jgi:hypothetical protein
MHRIAAGLASVFIAFVLRSPQQALWQADLQIRSLTVTERQGHLTARVVVAVEVGEAMGVRVEVLLPVGVGLLEMEKSCKPGPSAPGIGALRARVICTIGDLPVRGTRVLYVVTTTPPAGVARGFGVIGMSDTPDPRPKNNFAEKVIP